MDKSITREPEDMLTAFANDQRAKCKDTVEGKGMVTIATCKICGYMVWKSTDPNGIFGHTVENFESPEECPRCSVVIRRVPELFEWVCETVAKAQNDMMDQFNIAQNATSKDAE